LKAKFCILLIVCLFFLEGAVLVEAQDSAFRWVDSFNYSSLTDAQNAGWTYSDATGTSFSSDGVILDGTKNDVSIQYAQGFPSGLTDWKAEVKCMWLGQGHSVLSVFTYTEDHNYGFACDGYYKDYSLYRDSQKILTFGNYQETSGQWVTLTMIKHGNVISMYFNGELKNTYTEKDKSSQVTQVGLVSPWKGGAKYNYIMLGDVNAQSPVGLPTSQTGQSSFPTTAVLVGGGAAVAAVVGGALVYYFVFAGGSAAAEGATAGSGVAAVEAGASGSGSGEDNSGGGSTSPVKPDLTPQAASDANTENQTLGDSGSSVPLRGSATDISFGGTPQNTLEGTGMADVGIGTDPKWNQWQNMEAESQKSSQERLKIQQDIRNQGQQIQQNINQNTINTQNKIDQQMDQLIKIGNKPNGATVGSGEASSEGANAAASAGQEPASSDNGSSETSGGE
jgi:hypothetical protein